MKVIFLHKSFRLVQNAYAIILRSIIMIMVCKRLHYFASADIKENLYVK